MFNDKVKGVIQYILETILLTLIILVIYAFLKKYIVQIVRVEGASMETTIDNDDLLIINRLNRDKGYDRFDVIVFRPYNEDNSSTPEDESKQLYIKRIIGLPGETITIETDGKINITDKNGNKTTLEENYGSSVMGRGIDWNPDDNNKYETIVLGENQYFVLGDNRFVSLDSRSSKVQAVNLESVVGKYIVRVYPLFK